MGWLRQWAQRRAARTYIQCLAPVLAKGWGASKTYTPQQVDAAVKLARLSSRHISMAYAAFVSEADYRASSATLPRAPPYEAANKLVAQASPGPLAATYHYLPVPNSDPAGGDGSGL
jgi:hypothetical protein